MKNFKDIEKLLTDAKPPDRTVASTKQKTWERIIVALKKSHKRTGLLAIRPWIWTFASIILILVCILLMLWIKKY